MKKKAAPTYRPFINDSDRALRRRVDEILAKNPYLNKKGLEKMIFEAGLPVIEKNLAAITQ